MIGLSYEEAGLCMGFNKNLDQLQCTAQAIIDDKDAEIIRLRRELSILRAQNTELQAQVEDGNLEQNMRILAQRIDH